MNRLFVSFFALIVMARPIAAATVSTAAELLQAVATANATTGPDTIVVAPGTYALAAPIDVTDSLTVTGSASGHTVLEGGGFRLLNGALLSVTNVFIHRASGIDVVDGDLVARRIAINCVWEYPFRRKGIVTHSGARGAVTLENSSITECGPGIEHASAETFVMRHVSVSYNAGGVYNFGTMRAENSAIYSNPEGYDCGRGNTRIQEGSGNLDRDGSCWLAGSANLTISDSENLKMSETLADNGGPTPTFAVFAGSPAIDGGDPTHCLPVDQRGVLRPQGANCDIGAFEFDALSPKITGFSPALGPVGTSVTISATNLSTVTGVTFNGVPATSFSATSNSVTAIVPPGATTGLIMVGCSFGFGATATPFVVIQPPKILSFSPQAGVPGTIVKIFGTDLEHVTSVKFGSAVASFTKPGWIEAVVPDDATTGPITITNAAGSAVSSSNFAVLRGPIITAVIPGWGIAGTPVTITGDRFLGTTSVTFNGVPAPAFQIVSQNVITTTVPNGASEGFIFVTNADGPGVSPYPFFIAFDRATGTVGAGGTVSTLGASSIATASDPIETSVTHPFGGTILIEEKPVTGQFNIGGQSVNITVNPWTTATNPLIIEFRLHTSVAPDANIAITKDGAFVADCTGSLAIPDPCVASRQIVGDNVVLTVYTSSASDWQFFPGTPASTEGKAWGAGSIGGVHFDFNVSKNGARDPKGHIHVDDRSGTRLDIRDITTLAVKGNIATIAGPTFFMIVTDNGKSGDSFALRTSDGYIIKGDIDQGDIHVER